MKPARHASSSSRRTGFGPYLLRRIVSRIPSRWRGAVMLTAFTLLFPVWIAVIVGESLISQDFTTGPRVEDAPQH